MRGQAIDLFLWGYQEHFRILFKVLMDNVMKELGIPESGVECLLVGAKIPGCQNLNDVCVEPKDGKWPVELFDGLLDKIEKEIPPILWRTSSTVMDRACGTSPKISVGTQFV